MINASLARVHWPPNVSPHSCRIFRARSVAFTEAELQRVRTPIDSILLLPAYFRSNLRSCGLRLLLCRSPSQHRMFWSSFSSSKLKSHLSMSCERLRLQENKRKNKLKIERKEVAALVSGMG